MFGSTRAELLVLRRWPAAWGLLLLAPLVVLATDYAAQVVIYATLTPAYYGTMGTPAQDLPGMLPSQFSIVSVSEFSFSGCAAFIVLGAAMTGGDWGRGTIATSLLQAAGRIRTFAGQALALAIATALSVLATFAVAAASSAVIAAFEAHASPAAAAWPGLVVIAESAGAAYLAALTYAAIGLFLGTVCRSAAGAVAVALVYNLVVEGTVYDLGLQTGGVLRAIGDCTPLASSITVTELFGTPGGGASSQNYLPVRPAIAVWALIGYATLAIVATMVILRRRDAVPASRKHRLRRLRTAANDRPPRRPATGILGSLRAELLMLCKRPAAWALVLTLPLVMVLNSYVSGYVLYATANTGLELGLNAQSIMTTLLPGQYLVAVLGGLGQYNDLYGSAVFMLLGALIGGSDWGRRTIRTALLQGPSRLRSFTGQCLAVLVALAFSIALMFVLAAAASGIVALVQAGSPIATDTTFPAFGHVAEALAAALLLSVAYAAAGLALGVWLRSAGAAVGAVLVWAVVAVPSLDAFADQLHGILLRIYDVLPNASTDTLTNLFGNDNVDLGGNSVQSAQVAPALAFLTLALYAVACLAVPALLTRRRDLP